MAREGNGKDMVALSGKILRLTPSKKSIIFQVAEAGGVREVALPVSQIEHDPDDVGTGLKADVLAPRWLAENEGLL